MYFYTVKHRLHGFALTQKVLFWKHWSLLGQLCVLHAWRADPDPAQLFPPYNGAGLVHVRVLSWVPPPHVTVHASHDVHDAQLP